MVVERVMDIAKAVQEYLESAFSESPPPPPRLDWYLVLLKGIGQLAGQLMEREVPEESIGKLIGLVRAWKNAEDGTDYSTRYTYFQHGDIGLLLLVVQSVDRVGKSMSENRDPETIAEHLGELESRLTQLMLTYEVK